jgi:mono/diheme cytochrome c family protein
MKRPPLVIVAMVGFCLAAYGAANGAWLKKVPQADKARVNPYAGNPDAVAAGKDLFEENCAQCHGKEAEGKGSRPSLKSDRIRNATDGELAWLLKNGNLYKGMPIWGSLPEQQRWQIIAYVRSLQSESGEGTK